ncbi:MAG: endospore germination permease [Dehalobacterium sp.]
MHTKQEHISSYQLFIAVIFLNISTAVFFLPGEPVTIIYQNAWLAIIIATILEILLGIYPLVYLGLKFPKQTIIQYSPQILGKYGGKVMGLLLIFWFFQLHCWTIREFGEVSDIFLPETPLIAFIGILSLLTAFAVLRGIEVIARCGEFIFPIGMFFLLLIGFFSLSSMNLFNLRPFLNVNLLQILKATISPLDWLSTAVGFGVLAGFVRDPQKLKQVGILAVSLSGAVLLIFTIVILLVFGSGLLPTFTIPLLNLSQYIEVQGTEALVLTVWFSWILMRTALWSYITVFSISQLFNLSGYRFLVMGEIILATAYSINQYQNFMELSYFFSVAHLLYLIFQLGIPLVLWIVFLVRKKILN